MLTGMTRSMKTKLSPSFRLQQASWRHIHYKQLPNDTPTHLGFFLIRDLEGLVGLDCIRVLAPDKACVALDPDKDTEKRRSDDGEAHDHEGGPVLGSESAEGQSERNGTCVAAGTPRRHRTRRPPPPSPSPPGRR